jgi:hypothetical protein
LHDSVNSQIYYHGLLAELCVHVVSSKKGTFEQNRIVQYRMSSSESQKSKFTASLVLQMRKIPVIGHVVGKSCIEDTE